MPLVSVIIPTYKRPDYLTRAINSVLDQTYDNLEIIVVDDNNPGTDGRRLTEDIMSSYVNNPKVHYVKHEYNKNGAAARNTGFRESKGEYVAFLDDDDIYLPKKIESQVKRMESLSTDWGFCYNQYYTQKGNGPLFPVNEHREGDLYLVSLKHQGFCVNVGSNAMVRREAFIAVNGYDESFKRNQDHEFMVRLLRKYKIAYVPEPGLIYKIGTTNVVVDYEETLNHYIDAFKPYVEELDQENQDDFYKQMNRYRYNNRLISKNFKGAIKMIYNRDVRITDAMSLFCKVLGGYIKRRIPFLN